MTSPVVILVGGQILQDWMSMKLERKKKDLTGQLSVQIFKSYVPGAPVMPSVNPGQEILVYIGGHLVFAGNLDKRGGRGNGKGKGGGGSNLRGGGARAGGRGFGSSGTSISTERYTMTLSARGKCRVLADSSHRHPTATIKNATTKAVISKVIDPFRIQLDWRAVDRDMNRWRLRDGGNAASEIQRAASEYATYLWEGRDGRLIACDGTCAGMGEPLILGDNIKEFSAEQSEDPADTEIEVKGQRTKKDVWGRAAVNRKVRINDKWRKDKTFLSIPFQGDATEEALERRAKLEADDRAAASKKCSITVHHVQSRDGQPWDIGTLYYVEIPPENLYEVMECTGLVYEVTPDSKLETRMELSAAPSGGVEGGLTAAIGGIGSVIGGLAGVAGVASAVALGANFATRVAGTVIGALRRAQLGIVYVDGLYPKPWGPAQLAKIIEQADGLPVVEPIAMLSIPVKLPPLTLPAGLSVLAS